MPAPAFHPKYVCRLPSEIDSMLTRSPEPPPPLQSLPLCLVGPPTPVPVPVSARYLPDPPWRRPQVFAGYYKPAGAPSLRPARGRAVSSASPRDTTLAQDKPTVKRSNTFDKLKPLKPVGWSKGAKVAAPEPLSSDESEVVDIDVSRARLSDGGENENEPNGLTTGTFHGGSLGGKSNKLFSNLGRNKRNSAERLGVLIRVSQESRTSISSRTDSGEESSVTTTYSSSSSPANSLSARKIITRKSLSTRPPPATPTSSISSLDSGSDDIREQLRHVDPPAHATIVQPSPLRPDALKGAKILQHGEDREAQTRPITPPPRASSTPPISSNLGPENNPEGDEFYRLKAEEKEKRYKDSWQREYDRYFRERADHCLDNGLDILDYISLHMTDEQKVRLREGPWDLVGVGPWDAKWVVDRKKWEKHVKKLQKEAAKVQAQATKL